MGSRLELQKMLEQMLGSRNVYYQVPETLKMSYPAIKYSKSGMDLKKANNSTYSKRTRYELIVIDKRPDNPVIDKLLELPYSSYDRHYTADGLNHDSITIYY